MSSSSEDEGGEATVTVRRARNELEEKRVRSIATNGILKQSKRLSYEVFWHPAYLGGFCLAYLGLIRVSEYYGGKSIPRMIALLFICSAVFLMFMEIPCRRLYESLAKECDSETGSLAQQNMKHYWIAFLGEEIIGIIGLLPAGAPGALPELPTIVHWNVAVKHEKYANDLLTAALTEARGKRYKKIAAYLFSTDKRVQITLLKKGFVETSRVAFHWMSFFGLRELVLERQP
ncbi:hypothetical protein SJAG_01899 [Schizosaccharomyces japonicus yFS275]|uniref:Uncharacterized protein n=1 Tax=Schizosaccharomyces japonicus (strain yFS275 / FY16936) TaxID=402676 RepID=B6JZ74_SCHJY|nr:hypothetical protein SJAG_01899 [Schizosaccharomyces japonicus yFS275]EEB06842.1 hypothetical protein SJAG_01899 [Schizosaccharomyces japonicus yFS275]